MGAVFYCESFDGNISKDELKRVYARRRAEMERQHGTDPYNGTWSTLDGSIEFIAQSTPYPSYRAAEEAADAVANKRGAAVAVRYRDTHQKTVKAPTFDGLSGTQNNCAVLVSHGPNEHYYTRAVVDVGRQNPKTLQYERVRVAADQLSAATKIRLLVAAHAYVTATRALRDCENTLRELTKQLLDPAATVAPTTFTQLKRARTTLVKAHAVAKKTGRRLHELDEKYSAKLYRTMTQDDGEKWLIGGLCAS
jgi:hypothetical protein